MEALPDINLSQNRIADAEHAKITCCFSIKTNVITYMRTKSMSFIEPIIDLTHLLSGCYDIRFR